MNEVKISGRVIKDVELRTVGGNNSTVASVVLSHSRKNKKTDEWVSFIVEATCWHDLARKAAEYGVKGTTCLVTGSLAMDEWTDKITGQKRTKMKINAWELDFGDAPKRELEPDNSNSFNMHSDFNPDTSGSMDDIPF